MSDLPGRSIRLGGAKTTAVADSVPDIDVVVGVAVVGAITAAVASTSAPTGRRAAAGFAFCGGGFRTGAKASAADHPSF